MADTTFVDGITTVPATWLNDVNIETYRAQSGLSSTTALTNRTALSKFADIRSIKDYGAVCDGVTNDTAAIQRAINSPGAANIPVHILFPYGAQVKVSGTIYLPPMCTIDLNGSTLTGTNANTMFESGYWNGGTVVTNFGQPNESQLCYKTEVSNGFVNGCNIAFNLFNFGENSALYNIHFANINQAVYAKRCFFSVHRRLFARYPINAASLPCFHFDDEVNSMDLDGLAAVGWNVGTKFSGAKRGTWVHNCSMEAGVDGFNIFNDTLGLYIGPGNYFENLSGVALKFDAGGNHDNIVIDGNWFEQLTGGALTGSTITSGRWGMNRLGNGTVQQATNFTNRMLIQIPTDSTANNATAALPAAYTVGDTNLVDYVKHIYDSGTGLATVKGRVHGNVAPVMYAGDVGAAKNGTVPFATNLSVTTTVVTIDTNIRYRDGMMGGWSLVITDGGTLVITGLFIGTTKTDVANAGKTVTLSNNAGFLRIAVTGLTNASACTGYVRLFQ